MELVNGARKVPVTRLDVSHQTGKHCWQHGRLGGMQGALKFLRGPAASMLHVEMTGKYRADAQDWLFRASLMPFDSWDRDRLTTAAKLNYAIAELIERRNRQGGPLARLGRRIVITAQGCL